jgi:hypothetical protein
VSSTDGQQRLDEFAEEVKNLKMSGGLANPERTGSTIGVLLMVIGGFVVVILSFVKRGETSFEDSAAGLAEIIQATNNVWTALFGVALILIGLAIWIRNSLTRYFRYWLTRLIYEDRANTDRLIEAIERARSGDRVQL